VFGGALPPSGVADCVEGVVQTLCCGFGGFVFVVCSPVVERGESRAGERDPEVSARGHWVRERETLRKRNRQRGVVGGQ